MPVTKIDPEKLAAGAVELATRRPELVSRTAFDVAERLDRFAKRAARRRAVTGEHGKAERLDGERVAYEHAARIVRWAWGLK